MTNIVVFASGTGTNFQAIIDAIEDGLITDARITGLIAGKSGIKAIDRAKNHNIPTQVVRKDRFGGEDEFAEKLLELLNQLDANLLVLAGYLQKIPSRVIRHYKGNIINIHPSLLPAYGGKGYYGKKVHQAVLANGESESGCTVHHVTDKYDDGPIIGQRKVQVREDDTPETLAERISAKEHELLPAVIQELIHNDKPEQ